MERIFTPWRLAYLNRQQDGSACLFCAAPEERDDEALILHRGRATYVIINLYPYSNGHLMVVPHRHLGRLSEATPAERSELIETTARCEEILRNSYHPEGLNVGLNLGAAAGAGVVGHLHLHLVPRWSGDTNFITAIGGTRIIPETPPQTFARLQPLFAQDGAQGTQ
jgi:ATP adenylyltransferase